MLHDADERRTSCAGRKTSGSCFRRHQPAVPDRARQALVRRTISSCMSSSAPGHLRHPSGCQLGSRHADSRRLPCWAPPELPPICSPGARTARAGLAFLAADPARHHAGEAPEPTTGSRSPGRYDGRLTPAGLVVYATPSSRPIVMAVDRLTARLLRRAGFGVSSMSGDVQDRTYPAILDVPPTTTRSPTMWTRISAGWDMSA
jgi:hypothetical protein